MGSQARVRGGPIQVWNVPQCRPSPPRLCCTCNEWPLPESAPQHAIGHSNGRFGPEAAIMLIAVKVRFVRIPAVDPDRAYGNFWHFRNELPRVCRQLYSIVDFVTKICVGMRAWR
jgi:hypothetical protein